MRKNKLNIIYKSEIKWLKYLTYKSKKQNMNFLFSNPIS